ncbi:copper resistance protein [Recurvomyces mirabilis]|uniref:Crh-like protein n=1 Tax=Recurvomyces mirabilis TaxID=574656 RepID=A0AAE0WPK9_9PEZI|nr:copper resistance protein [Recurvomyces mirabilis]KAK5152852.1 copper resistance protein [Recurvomyces mirabilis]
MRFSRSQAAVVLASVAATAKAQTSTACDPTKKTCPADTGLNSKTYYADFTQGSSANASWSGAAYTVINYGKQGAEFSISKGTEAPTIQTDFYFFFGRVDVKMKAAPGTGIVSSIVLESDDLDEVDWEFLGGNTGQVQTNFFGKGNTTTYDRSTYYAVTNPQTQFHTYSVDWTSDKIDWLIDGVIVRTLKSDDPTTVGGQNFPQTPMRLKLGNWCGGCSGEPEGTVQWAGGQTEFGGDPYVMYVESVGIQNYNPADSYTYGDTSGSWESIKCGSDNAPTASPSGSAASVAITPNPTSSTASATAKNATSAASTSSVSVAGIDHQTVAAVSSTSTGSSYSMNTASVSAQNSDSMTAAASASAATTEVPKVSPTAGRNGSNATTTGGPSPSHTNGALVNTVMTAGSILSIAAAFLLL